MMKRERRSMSQPVGLSARLLRCSLEFCVCAGSLLEAYEEDVLEDVHRLLNDDMLRYRKTEGLARDLHQERAFTTQSKKREETLAQAARSANVCYGGRRTVGVAPNDGVEGGIVGPNGDLLDKRSDHLGGAALLKAFLCRQRSRKVSKIPLSLSLSSRRRVVDRE